MLAVSSILRELSKDHPNFQPKGLKVNNATALATATITTIVITKLNLAVFTLSPITALTIVSAVLGLFVLFVSIIRHSL
jgi:hypothetical protein